jgi:centrosomal protein CEP104
LPLLPLLLTLLLLLLLTRFSLSIPPIQAHFERLGYLSLNSNQRSNYQARELKSVFINCTGRYLRILAHRCYVNKYNLSN